MVSMLPLHFCSCIPRSGSTLLMCLLGQNPAVHVTPTNDGLSNLFVRARDTWMAEDSFRAQGLKQIEPRIAGMLRGMLEGFYSSEFNVSPRLNKTIIDKSRIWLGHIDLLEMVLERPVKIIVPVRPVEDVLASFERLHRKASLTEPGYTGPLDGLRQTLAGRVMSYLASEAVLGSVISRLRDVIDCGLKDRLMIVPFKWFTEHPKETVAAVSDWLELPPFDYDIMNVKQIIHEDDSVYGLDLHTIREGPITPMKKSTWPGILKEDMAVSIQQEYTDINILANYPPSWAKKLS